MFSFIYIPPFVSPPELTMSATDPNLPHDSKAGQVLAVCASMLVFTTLVVGARVWIRLKLAKGGLGADDWCILVAWVLVVSYNLDPITRKLFQICRRELDFVAQSIMWPLRQPDIVDA